MPGRRQPQVWEFRLPAEELELLRHVLRDLDSMLAPDEPDPAADADATPDWARELGLQEPSASVRPPSDPALARLLPDGSAEDPLIAEEFRRLTEPSLRAAKREAIAQALAPLDNAVDGRVQLTTEQLAALLRALTDVRLVIAQRLEIESDADAEALHEWLVRDAERSRRQSRRQDGSMDASDAAEAGEGAPADDVAGFRWMAGTYEFLTELQQVLADLLLRELPREGDQRRLPPPTGGG